MDRKSDDLLDATLSAARKHEATVNADGSLVARRLHGVEERRLTTHVDGRGQLVELYDTRWDFAGGGFAYSYATSCRPGAIKAWGMHERKVDRYAILFGDADLILYDVRPDSPTCGQVCRVALSDRDRRLVSIPCFVWHAFHCIGDRDAVIVNYPTTHYDHADPDKFSLPWDTPLIPWDFGAQRYG